LSTPQKSERERRRLAFVADRQGWAFDNIARNVGALLGPEFEISRCYALEYGGSPKLLYDLYISESFDNVHFIGREIFFDQLDKLISLCKLARTDWNGLAEIAGRLARPVTTATVYDHLFLDDASVADRQEKFAVLDGYSTSSLRLLRTYSNRYRRPPLCLTQDGVDLDLFRPENIGRYDRADEPLVVGWAGNSLWPRIDGARRPHERDPKGLHSIIIPAIERLCNDGVKVAGNFADRNTEWRPYESMPSYYAGLHVLLCASEQEGTPNPVLEAMACGVPVISTDVGIVPEAFGPEQSRFIIQERTIDAFVAAIKTLYDDRSRLRALSQENLKSVQTWSWQSQAHKWRRFFEEARRNHGAHRDEKKLLLTSIAERAWQERYRWFGLYRLGRRIARTVTSKARSRQNA
jgi:glycosyltransferase involved in cell wall biosynthesis